MKCRFCGSKSFIPYRKLRIVDIKDGIVKKSLEEAKFCGKCGNLKWGVVKDVSNNKRIR